MDYDQNQYRTKGTSGGRAFTLWELVLTIAVIGVLSGVAYPLYYGVRKTGEDRVMVSRVQALRAALITFEDRVPGAIALWKNFNSEQRYGQLVSRGYLRNTGLSWEDYQNGYHVEWPEAFSGRIRLFDSEEREIPCE